MHQRLGYRCTNRGSCTAALRLLGLFSVVLLAAASPVLAQDEAQQSSGIESESLQALEAKRAELSYKITRTPENYRKMVAAFNDYVGEECLAPAFLKHDHNPANNSKECQFAIERGLEVYKFLPTALCGRFGIESGTCRDANRVTEFGPLDTSDIEGTIAEKLEIQSLKPGPELNEEQAAFFSVTSQYRQTPSEALRYEGLTRARKLLQALCKVRRTSFESIGAAAHLYEEPHKGPLGLARPAPTPGKAGEGLAEVPDLKRFVLVSKPCRAFVNEVLKFEAKFPDAICIKFGDYSPQCFDAYKEWQALPAKRSTKPQSKKPPKDSGLSRF